MCTSNPILRTIQGSWFLFLSLFSFPVSYTLSCMLAQQQPPPSQQQPQQPRTKSHVQRACMNCRRAHLACDTERPCRRCASLGKEDGCFDVDHKKRGRPKTKPNDQAKRSEHDPVQYMHPSAFTMTTSLPTTEATNTSPVITAFLSMEICCARVSDEVQTLLGYYPQELAHRSLYSFIAPQSSEALARLHRILLDNVTDIAQRVDSTYDRAPPTERTTSEKFFNHHPDTLMAIANGSQTIADMLWVKHSDGSLQSVLAQFYLGGGLGANLYVPDTLGNLYIVCLLSQFQPSHHNQQQPMQSLSNSAVIEV
ncbi:hypothetical protein BX666DRAFT_243744 [Dichotomocladium elegans]|nr:hypothetical protein BX666DRAFT_243744 [Dichotomocladium elegans]